MLEVTLDAFALPDDHKIYKCFPGESYKFYDPIYRQGIAFLDIRGLDTLGDKSNVWDDAELLQAVTFDVAARGASKRGRRKASKRRSPAVKRNFNAIKGLLNDVQKGDLIVVPPPGYRRNVLIGEVLDDPGNVAFATGRDGDSDFQFAGRRVRWLGEIEKRMLGTALLDRLHTSNPFFLIPESQYEGVYDVAYRNYVKRGVYVSTFETSKEQFSSTDSLLAALWFNGLAGVDAADGRALPGNDFIDIAVATADEEASNEMELNINSPGTMLVRSTGPFALALMSMLPLSAAEAQQFGDGDARIIMRAVGGADPNCALNVESAVAEYVRTLGPQRLLQSCEYGEKVRTKATLNSRARLKTVSKKRISKG